MTGKELIVARLESDPSFRERKNKDKGIASVIAARHWGVMQAIKEGLLNIDSFAEALQDYASLDRSWRKALEEDPKLRGTDYDDKDELEAKKMEELGYRPPKQEPPPQQKLL